MACRVPVTNDALTRDYGKALHSPGARTPGWPYGFLPELDLSLSQGQESCHGVRVAISHQCLGKAVNSRAMAHDIE